jgi:uncharacterized protein
MIVYYDTSALLKLFIEEEHSAAVRAKSADAHAIVVCELTWVEMHSALGRRIRQGESDEAVAWAALESFKSKWTDYSVINLNPELIQSAGLHAQSMGLRAYDSVQLDSARQAERALDGELAFLSFDKQLNTAARVLGMKVLDL